MQYRKILVLTANPRDTSRLRLDQEVREITNGLQRAKHREVFKLEQRWAVQARDLRQALLEVEPEIVHFSGHGSDERGLFFESSTGDCGLVAPEALAELFELCTKYIKCVILNACYSETQARSIHRYVPTVIGMQHEIGDEAAIEFSVGFYDALGAGRTTSDAYRFGCNAISLEGIPGGEIPILLENKSKSNNALSEDWSTEAYVSLHLVQGILEKSSIPRKGADSHWYPQFRLKQKSSFKKLSGKNCIADFYIKDCVRGIEFLIEVKAANNKIDDSARFQLKSYLQHSGIKFGAIIDPFKIEFYELVKNRFMMIRGIEIEDVENLYPIATAFSNLLDSIGNENNSNPHF